MSTLIIADTVRMADNVRQWVARHGSTGAESMNSCPQLEQQPYTSLAATSVQSALRDLQGFRPRRIIIVNYTAWRPPPGHMTSLWRMIRVARARGCEVVWW